MPLSYEQAEPELYKEARRLFQEGMKSPAKISPAEIRRKLIEEFGENRVPSWRTIWRYCKAWKAENSITSSVDKLTALEVPSDTSQSEPFIQDQDIEPVREADVELVNPLGLPELIEKGIPGKVAVRLLANWDVAYAKPDRERSDWYYSFQTMICQRAVDIFTEFPNIPYEKAISLAELELKADIFNVKLAKEIAQLSRRYRIWEGSENLKAFWEVFDRLHPEFEERRQKRATRGILSRLFEKNRGIEEEA